MTCRRRNNTTAKLNVQAHGTWIVNPGEGLTQLGRQRLGF
jgi:hypothetical protein